MHRAGRADRARPRSAHFRVVPRAARVLRYPRPRPGIVSSSARLPHEPPDTGRMRHAARGHPAGRQDHPMKREDIGFRELLERVLPLQELPPAERLQVQRALNSGIESELERAAYLTIETL